MTGNEIIITGQRSVGAVDELVKHGASICDTGERIDFISRQFLGTAYQETTLVGTEFIEEVFAVNLEGVDCFTYVDYIEAMRLAETFREFKEVLKKIRYRCGVVAFGNRNHFFSDWRDFNKDYVEDVTSSIGLQNTMTVTKTLNLREDGTRFVAGIDPVQREITYIPSSSLDDRVAGRLKTGDYIGIYSEIEGLDVSHVGIFVREGDSIILRHASSKKDYRKVVDQDFMEYVRNMPGIVVLRPKG